jgi:uncharacterized protein
VRAAVFVDTWAFRALADAADPAHAAARALEERVRAAGAARVTTDYVLDEAMTGIRARSGFRIAARFLDEVEALAEARLLRVERITEARFRKAGGLFRRLNGKLRLSFTDCTSFVVMREERIAWAFTADAHFDHVGRDIHAIFALTRGGAVTLRPLPFA